MPVYDNDECVQCGGIRTAKSNLCVDCLVRSYENANEDNHEKARRIKKLEERNERANMLCDRLLDHISSEAVYIAELRIKLFKAERRGNGKDGME